MNFLDDEEVVLPVGTTTVVKRPDVVVEPPKLPTLGQVEKEYILHVLKESKNNKTAAVKVLGITLKSLYNKLHEYGEFENFAKIIKKTDSK